MKDKHRLVKRRFVGPLFHKGHLWVTDLVSVLHGEYCKLGKTRAKCAKGKAKDKNVA